MNLNDFRSWLDDEKRRSRNGKKTRYKKGLKLLKEFERHNPVAGEKAVAGDGIFERAKGLMSSLENRQVPPGLVNRPFFKVWMEDWHRFKADVHELFTGEAVD